MPEPETRKRVQETMGRVIVQGVGIGWLVGWLMATPVAASGPLQKLARGVANTATGWVELPAQVGRTTEVQGSIAGMSVGVARGLARGLQRTAVGVWEVATFPFPNRPEKGRPGLDPYGPIVQPEFVIVRRADA